MFNEINQLLPVPHICVQSLELHAGFQVFVSIRLSTNHNHESCIWQLWEVTCHILARVFSHIRRRSLVAPPSLLRRHPNLACTVHQKHLNPLLPNPFGIIENIQLQPCLESLQNICNHHLPVVGSISLMFQTVLSLDDRPMLLLEKPRHPYFLPFVEGTEVGLPHRFGNMLQGEFCSLQAG